MIDEPETPHLIFWPACPHCGSTSSECGWFEYRDDDEPPCGAIPGDKE